MSAPEAEAAASAQAEDDLDELDDHEYLARVMAEIDAEVRRRRASGDLPPRLERELDELFLAHSPVAGRGGALADALRMVDAAAYVDPAVPVASDRPGGAFVKKGLRSLSSWYISWVAQQVNQFATATSRALHLVEDGLGDLRRQLEGQQPPETPVVELAGDHGADAFWVAEVTERLGGNRGRVLHAASGDGWLVGHLRGAGVDAYGVDPRPFSAEAARRVGADELDLREEGVLEHLESVEQSGLAGVVLSGVVDGMGHGERNRLLGLLAEVLGPEGILAVVSATPAAWDSAEAPPECDVAPGRPLRVSTWSHLLVPLGFEVTTRVAPDERSYLVLAVLRQPPAR